MDTTEPLLLKCSCFKVETVTKRLKRYKSPGIHKTLAQMNQAGGNAFLRSINSLILFGMRNNFHSSGRNKNLSHTFPTQNGLEYGDAFYNYSFRICHQEGPGN
jgi:hypothetical protein